MLPCCCCRVVVLQKEQLIDPFLIFMDRLSNLRVNCIKGKDPLWTWQDLAQMQRCVNTALSLPETQLWCSPAHAAPTWALLAWLAPLRSWGLGCCQWAGTFLHHCLWASPASWKWAPQELWSRNTEWAEKEKLSRFVIIQGIQPLIIMCNGELKEYQNKTLRRALAVSFYHNISECCCLCSFLTEAISSHPRSGNTKCRRRGKPHCVARLLCWDLPQGKICLQKSWPCSQEATHLKTVDIEHYCLGAGQMLCICTCSCLLPSLLVRGLEFSANW